MVSHLKSADKEGCESVWDGKHDSDGLVQRGEAPDGEWMEIDSGHVDGPGKGPHVLAQSLYRVHPTGIVLGRECDQRKRTTQESHR